jgi:hypothetical protein
MWFALPRIVRLNEALSQQPFSMVANATMAAEKTDHPSCSKT